MAEIAPASVDARGIVAPERGLTRFTLDRAGPTGPAARLVDRYWLVRWDLPVGITHTQAVLAHPVVNVVATEPDGLVMLTGPATAIGRRELHGRGAALGIQFRPSAFHALTSAPATALTDQVVPAADVLPARVIDGLRAGLATGDATRAAAVIDAALAPLVPAARTPAEQTAEWVERVAADRSLLRVDALAELAGTSVRSMQRRFAEHVGLSPKAVIRRYRLYDAAERVRAGARVDWAAVAAELGYTDQAHLIRDFSAGFGTTPQRYADAARVPPSDSR